MVWYETQIFGVVVGAELGGCIGFFVTEGHKRLERIREKKRILAGIKAEMNTQKEFLQAGLERIEKLIDELKQTGGIEILHQFAGEFNLPFLDNNFDKVGTLQKELAEKVIEYRGILGAAKTSVDYLPLTIQKFWDSKVPAKILLGNLGSALASYKRMIQLSGEITYMVDSEI